MRHNQQQHLAALHHSLKISPSLWGTSEHFVPQIKKPRYRAINCLSWNLMHWVSDPNQEFAHPKSLSGRWRKMDISGVWAFFPVEGPSTGHVCPSREVLVGPGGTSGCQLWWEPMMTYLCPVNGVGVAQSSSQTAGPWGVAHFLCSHYLITPAVLGGQMPLLFSEKNIDYIIN